MNKKIIFFAPNIEDGGIEKNIILLSDFLIKKNYCVEIVFSKLSRKIKKKLNNNVILSKSSFNFNFFFRKRINNSINCFLYFIFKHKKKNDVILSFQDHPFSIISSYLKKIPCIIRIANHPIGSIKYFNSRINLFLKILIKIFFYQFAGKIISNSKESTNFLKKYIFKKNTCYTIYNPIKLKKIKLNKQKKNYILSVGRLTNQKNYSCLINGFNIFSKKNKKYKLIIIGKGTEKGNITAQIKKYKLNKKILLLDHVNPNNYLQTSKIFVLSSLWEGLPNVLLEALLYKIPIISSNCQSGPKEILKNGKYGYLFKNNDPEDLAKKLMITTINYNKSKIKAKMGFYSLKKYNYETQCKKYLKLLKS